MLSRKHSRRSLALILLLGVAACSGPRPVVQSVERADAPVNAPSYLGQLDTSRIYAVDPTVSRLFVRVGRSGAMARFGHDHIVASESLSGFVELEADESLARADLAFPVGELIVDKPEYRSRFALETSPTEQEVADTVTNMLKVLRPERNPWVSISVAPDSGDTVQASIRLNGQSVTRTLPVTRSIAPDRIQVSGRTQLRHSDFGLQPFTAFGGLLAVADEFDIVFEIEAVRR